MYKLLILPLLVLSLSGTKSNLAQISYSQAWGEYSLSDINTGYIFYKAIAEAYPEISSEPRWEEEDWMLSIRGQDFYWAGGRILNRASKNSPNYKQKSVQTFRDYPEELAEHPGSSRYWRPSNHSQKVWAGLRRSGSRRNKDQEFMKTLYNTWEQADMLNKNLVEIRFLGKRVKVHKLITTALERVEETLEEERQQDLELDEFLKSLQGIGGFYWRNIAGTNNLSLHSYGIAVDLLPYKWVGVPYWYWIKDQIPNWSSYPYEKRWQVPRVVIKTFEREGFTWGGKWYMFDNMHFEYHPEINKLKPYFASLKN